jgi:flagellar hook protein FlgE
MAVGSFSAGLSGLNANAAYLSVIGNNLANINTIGFKASSVTFMDLVSQTVGGSSQNPMQVGLGVVTGSISPVFSQGAIESTREATNVAIQGGGFFVVAGDNGTAYTRAGNFSFDSNGTLVTPDGFRVQGWTATDQQGRVITNGQPGDISVPPGVLRQPVATELFGTLTNLDANAPLGSTFTTSVQIYDALGQSHLTTITYTNTAPGAWDWQLAVNGSEVDDPAAVAGTPFVLAGGTIGFNATGQLETVTVTAPGTGGGALPADSDMDVTFTTPPWKNGAAANTLTWDLTDANLANSLTGFAARSATSSIRQNGSAAGMIDNITILKDGTIQATFGAGQTVAVGQLALASFNNPKGLVKLGGNKFGESQSAGIPNVGAAGSGGRGTLIGSALEQSNVDIAQEFTQMILAQRGYQANSKTITVSDELLLDTLSLKR